MSQNPIKVMVLEDEISMNRGIAFSLERGGFHIVQAYSVEEAMKHLSCMDEDIYICDITLPDGSGLDFVRAVREKKQNRRPYVICLTALDTEADFVIGYEAGVDDYISKPFSLSVLMLKLEAYARRLSESYQPNDSKAKEVHYRSGEICFDSERMVVTSGGETIPLTKNEVKLQSYITMLRDRAILEQEEVKSIVTDISHQLKTPVSVMDMSLSLLEDEGLSSDERKEFMGRMRGSMKELEILLDSLIQISRMESGLIEIKPEEKPLADTIMTAVNCVFLKADEKHISIEMDDEENIGELSVPHDPKWMAEAFINILENAIKYSPAESCITIRPSLRNGFLRVEIEDEGIGIPKNERNKVLTRFYRGNHKVVQEETGSGIGLFLANKIIRMHGGMVLIRSGRGRIKEFPGTIMVLQIPADPEYLWRLTEL